MIDPDDYLFWNSSVATAAYAIARQQKFHGHVDRDDIVGHLWEFVLRHLKETNNGGKPKLVRYREDNDDAGYEKIVASVLYDEANIFARKEKAARLGYSTADEFFYSKGMIEDLLGAMFETDSWTNPPTDHQSDRSGKALNEGNNWLATLSDVSNAYGQLEEKDRQNLALAFKHDVSRVKLAEMWQLSRKGADHRIEASIKRLWRNLGGPKWLAPEERDRHTGTIGNRRAMSNAQARAIQENQYDAS